MPYMKRLLGNVAYSSGAVQTLSLPREHFYNRLLLQVVLNATGGTATTYGINAQLRCVSRVEIIANGQLVIKSFSWVQKYLQNVLIYGTAPYEIGRGAASQDYRTSAIVVEFGNNTSDITSLLPSHLLASLDLKITYDTLANLGTSLVAGTLGGTDVYSLEMINQGQDARAAILNKETVLSLSPSATGFAEFNLSLGNVYRSFNLQTRGGIFASTTGYTNTTVQDIEVVQDGVVYHRKTNFKEMLFENVLESQLANVSGVLTGAASSAATVGFGAGEVTGLNIGWQTGAVTDWATVAAGYNIPAGNVLINFDYQNYNQGGSSNPVALIRAIPHLPDSSRMSSFKVRCNVPSVANAVTLDLLMQELVIPKVRRR